ncbi:hypothetical protein PanWU01x14_233120 [Parasponia andersonii]|uniref:Uncharacterized protein n=1 Tax=Parasponia andersonii TaxID=3476 RepID=A0A2P5BJV0_PARAD|nr:hypothetical protein PanWU01x14_233120 [Parasponia andersonii]
MRKSEDTSTRNTLIRNKTDADAREEKKGEGNGNFEATCYRLSRGRRWQRRNLMSRASSFVHGWSSSMVRGADWIEHRRWLRRGGKSTRA